MLPHDDNILNKFRILKEGRSRMRKPYQLTGWTSKNSSYYRSPASVASTLPWCAMPSTTRPRRRCCWQEVPVGWNFTRISVTDSDGGDGGQLTYYFLHNGKHVSDQGPFHIDKATGVITTTGRIDRESNEIYQVTALCNALQCSAMLCNAR